MTWVRRAVPEGTRKHYCPVPIGVFGVPSGDVGDLWRCDTCGSLWRIGYVRGAGLADARYLGWRPATWWQRMRYPYRPEVPPPVTCQTIPLPYNDRE